MDTEALEALLGGAEETPNLEFKCASEWSARLFLKDILAMANTLDGGQIVVGIEDNTLARQGLSEQQAASYDPDIMRDQIRPFADPHVQFRRHVVVDAAGMTFVVIDVSSFEELPVICSRDGHDVNEGVVYFRSRRGRPRSERIGTSAEMREVIEASIARRLQSLQRVGIVPEPEGYDFDAELGDL